MYGALVQDWTDQERLDIAAGFLMYRGAVNSYRDLLPATKSPVQVRWRRCTSLYMFV
jgi:hypothetical protein